MQRRIPLHSRYHASPQILPRPLLVVDFLEGLLARRAAVGSMMTGRGCRGVSPSALVQRLFSIGGRELNFKLMDLVPLGVSSPTLRYRKKLVQPSAGGHRFWCVHGGIIPSFASAVSPARGEPGWKRAHSDRAPLHAGRKNRGQVDRHCIALIERQRIGTRLQIDRWVRP